MQENKSNYQSKVKSLQALRGMSCIGIFLLHAGARMSWAELGVSIFFVLSGFLLMKFGNPPIPYIKDSFVYMVKKIRRLYVLHIVSMVAILVFYSIAGVEVNKNELVVDIVLNVFLIQSWVPFSDVNTSLNGVAWFLSTMVFLYLIFPYLKIFLEKKKTSFFIIFPIVIIVIQVMLCIPMLVMFSKGGWRTYVWFMYCNPLFRTGDFIVGCCLAKLVNHIKSIRLSVILASICEMVVLCLTLQILHWLKWTSDEERLVFRAMKNWTSGYLVLASMWIVVFYIRRGVLSFVIDNNVIRLIGDFSPYIFLIHYVVVIISNHCDALTSLPNLIRIIVIALTTMGLVTSYRLIERWIIKMAKKRKN